MGIPLIFHQTQSFRWGIFKDTQPKLQSYNVLRLGDFYWGMCHNGGGARVCGTSSGNNDLDQMLNCGFSMIFPYERRDEHPNHQFFCCQTHLRHQAFDGRHTAGSKTKHIIVIINGYIIYGIFKYIYLINNQWDGIYPAVLKHEIAVAPWPLFDGGGNSSMVLYSKRAGYSHSIFVQSFARSRFFQEISVTKLRHCWLLM